MSEQSDSATEQEGIKSRAFWEDVCVGAFALTGFSLLFYHIGRGVWKHGIQAGVLLEPARTMYGLEYIMMGVLAVLSPFFAISGIVLVLFLAANLLHVIGGMAREFVGGVLR